MWWTEQGLYIGRLETWLCDEARARDRLGLEIG